jgi:hypothetical protein
MIGQVSLPSLEIIDEQGEMIPASLRINLARPLANQMQLLIDAQAKPGAGKRKRRPRNRLQPQHIAVKLHAPLDIGNVQSDVVELGKDHFRFQI